MTHANGRGFHFGLEAEYLLVEAETFRPLWHRDLSFVGLNSAPIVPTSVAHRSSGSSCPCSR